MMTLKNIVAKEESTFERDPGSAAGNEGKNWDYTSLIGFVIEQK